MSNPTSPQPAEAAPGAVRTAAVDCGTNSVRLLIADVPAQGPLAEVVREMTITRLGQGVDRTGRLDPAALARTLDAIARYAALCADHGVGAERIRMVATSATRDAANREEFVAGVRERLGVEPEVVSGDTEASLSFAGAASVRAADAADPALVVDIGGGSTELVLGDAARGVQALTSMDIGSVRLTERHFTADPPTAAEVEAARRDVRAALDAAERSVPLGQARSIIGLAGSVTTLAGHVLGLDAYDRDAIDGRTFRLEQWHAAAAAMSTAPRPERAAMGFLHPGRVDVIAAGALVWDEVLGRVALRTAEAGHPVEAATVSEHDILDGIALAVARG